jgi:hypothetical protein
MSEKLSSSSFVNNLKLPPLTKDEKPSLLMCFFALKKWINWSAVVRKSYGRVVFEETLLKHNIYSKFDRANGPISHLRHLDLKRLGETVRTQRGRGREARPMLKATGDF